MARPQLTHIRRGGALVIKHREIHHHGHRHGHIHHHQRHLGHGHHHGHRHHGLTHRHAFEAEKSHERGGAMKLDYVKSRQRFQPLAYRF